MTSKHPSAAADSTGLSSLSRFSPRFSLESSLLASIIPLPENPLISYAVWEPAHSAKFPDWLSLIEQARKRLVQQNDARSLLDSLLPSLHISGGTIALYVFAIGSVDRATASRRTLSLLSFVGLTGSGVSSFTPAGLYPCSELCSTQFEPCFVCMSTVGPVQTTSSARLLPRRSLRRPFIQFLDSVRERLIHLATESPRKASPRISAVRFRNGMLFGTVPSQSEWRSGWDRYSHDHPLTYCELTVHLSQVSPSSARFVVQPWLRLSHYHPLVPSLPMTAGTPIVLLPNSVPAYFLSAYTGPASGLTLRFSEALLGLGAGDWKSRWSQHGSTRGADPSYVIAWVQVQNKPEDEKGIILVWPASLCVGFIPGASSKHAQSILDNIPTLPAHLQASPPPTEVHTPLALLSATDPPPEQGIGSSLSQRTSPNPASSRPSSPHRAERFTSDPRWPHPGLRRSPSFHTLQAFRSLTLQHAPRDIGTVTSDVSRFVGTVAREREKERERIRRERHNSGTIPTVGLVTTPAAVPASSPQQASAILESTVASPEVVSHSPDITRSGGLFSDEDSNPDTSMQDDTADFSPTSPEVKLEAIDVPPIASTSAGPGLDSFPIFDSSWTQSTGDFLPQSSDYGMNFSLNMDDGDDLGMGESFGVFTEDDFDFFNGPTLASSSELAAVMPTVPDGFLAAAFSPAAIIGPSLTALVRSPLEEGLPSGVGPPSAQSQPSPWAVFHGTESLTPQPEPIHTPKHLSERIHTTVQIIEQRITNIPSSHPISRYPNAFDPIPFNTTHRISDGKYVLGKFALPSPPSEDDTDYKGSRTSLNLSITLPSAKWKSSYSSATDPRVGMTQRLVGVKRKLSAQGGRVPNVSPGRFRDHDEWIQADLPLVEDASDSDNEECWIVDEQDPLSPDPKPATPPPSYLPLGPTLLQTYFHYQFLQPYTVALDTSGTAAHNTTTTPAAISAPTPISPAAILGSSSEKTKSLEAASQILLREAVENPVWADAWRASAAASNTRQCPSDIWPADLKYTASLLNGVESSSCPVDLDTLLQPSSDGSALRAVDCPLLTIGKAGEIMNILPTALRFWEKLGLSPRNGPKDITAFIVFDQTHLQEEREVGELLGRLSAVYTTKRYGKHDAGRAPGCTQDGIFPTRFESIRKTLSTFATGITERSSSSIVVYIVTPDHILRMTSPILRQVLSAIKRISKNRQATSPILFQFVPERLLAASAPSSLEGASLEAFVDSVYDRILCPVDRHVSCRYPPSVEDTRMYLQFPAFTLAKPLHPEVKFVKAEAVEILDVVDRYSMLHVGYQVTRQGKWLLTTCVDHRGEVHDLRAWLMPEDDTVDSFTVNSVWDFAMSMATKANVEWHVVIAKRGVMTAHEMDAWSSHLEVLVRGETTPPMQVSLLSVDQDNPWYFFVKPSDTEALSSSATRGFKATGNLAMDVSSTTLALLSSRTTPIPMRIYPGIAVDQLSSVDSKESPSMDELGVLPLATQTLVHIPSQTDHTCISMLHLHFLYFSRSHNSTSTLTDAETSRNVAKSFQELKVLAQARWATRGSNNLPLHFAALEVMLTTLDEPDGLLDL